MCQTKELMRLEDRRDASTPRHATLHKSSECHSGYPIHIRPAGCQYGCPQAYRVQPQLLVPIRSFVCSLVHERVIPADIHKRVLQGKEKNKRNRWVSYKYQTVLYRDEPNRSDTQKATRHSVTQSSSLDVTTPI